MTFIRSPSAVYFSPCIDGMIWDLSVKAYRKKNTLFVLSVLGLVISDVIKVNFVFHLNKSNENLSLDT